MREPLGKIIAWEYLSDNRYPDPLFERDFAIGPVQFDLFCEKLRLVISISGRELSFRERKERAKLIAYFDLCHFTIESEEIVECIDALLLRIDVFRGIGERKRAL